MPSWKKVYAYVELTRPYNITAVLLIFFIGFSFQPFITDWKQLFYGALLLILFHSAATVQNDIEDKEIDKANHMNRPLLTTISLAEAKIFLNLLLLAALGLSLLLLPLNSIFVPILFILIWLYNTKPFVFSRRPLLSIVTLGLVSTVAPLLYGFLLAGHQATNIAILWIFSWFLVRISITLLKDYKDEKGDRLFHKRTFFLTYGRQLTTMTSFILALIGYTSLFIISFFLKENAVFLAIPFLFAVMSFLPRIKLLRVSDNKEANIIFHNILVKENRFELIYLLWIIFSR